MGVKVPPQYCVCEKNNYTAKTDSGVRGTLQAHMDIEIRNQPCSSLIICGIYVIKFLGSSLLLRFLIE
jgi:hypothetical protein